MNNMSFIQSGYTAAAKDARVLNANAHELITILFEELLNLLDEIHVIQTRDPTRKIVDQQALALSIVDSLIVSLDMERGGELAHNLRRNYSQARALIVTDDSVGGLENNRAAYKIISEISSAWSEIA